MFIVGQRNGVGGTGGSSGGSWGGGGGGGGSTVVIGLFVDVGDLRGNR